MASEPDRGADAAQDDAPIAIDPLTLRRIVLPLLAFSSFTVVFNNLIITPLLKDISEEFDVSVGITGLLITAYALSAGTLAFFAGPIIDRYGRRPVIIVGMTVIAAATFAAAFAPNFAVLIVFRSLAGFGVAGLQPAVFAAVGDYFPYKERGRAMGWVITANTAASVVGVPVGALLAQFLSWRITFVVLGAITTLAAIVIYTRFPRFEPRASVAGPTNYRADYAAIFRKRPAVALLFANLLGAMFWFAWITYIGAFYEDEFDLSTGQLAPVLSTLGLGVLVGSNVGGRVADRTAKKPVVIWSGLAVAALIIIETNVVVAVWLAALVNFVYAMPGGARFAAATAMMTEMAPERRGTMMAINASFQQFGIMAGAATGALAVSLGGFATLGMVVATVSIISTLIVIRYVDEDGAVVAQPTPASA